MRAVLLLIAVTPLLFVGAKPCRVKAVVVQQVAPAYAPLTIGTRSLIVTPHAYPLAVPVAVPSYVQYGYPQALVAPDHYQGKPYEQYAREYRAYVELLRLKDKRDLQQASGLRLQASGETATAAGRTLPNPSTPAAGGSLVTRSCVRCHSGAEAKRGLDLTAGTPADKLDDAIRRVLSEDPELAMPPPNSPEGEALGNTDRGELVLELAAEPEP